jgi:putative flippase GtrA
MRIAYLYTIFAIIAILLNIATQDVVGYIYNGQYKIYVAILFGTASGLLVKYILDKKYIFQQVIKNFAEDTYLFFLYAVMGVITTLIFWGFELLFECIFATKMWRYLGGVLGLSIGYAIKYYLDKRFVFKTHLIN